MVKKNILIVLYYYDPYVSGLSVYAKSLAVEFVKKGHRVRILTTKFRRDLQEFEIVDGVEIQRCPILFSIGKGVISLKLFVHAIRLSYSFDIVNYHLPFAEAGFAMMLMPKKKIYTTYHCDINLGSGLVNTIVERLSYFGMRIGLSLSRKIIVSSIDYFKKSKMNKYIDKAIEISPPIDTRNFIKQFTSDNILEEFNLTEPVYKIGFVGRVVYEKGIQYLLESIPLIEKKMEGDDFVILIAGDYENVAGGSIKEELDIYIQRYPNRIRFTGFLSDSMLVQFYSLIDILILPSIDPLEAFGMVQIEAMCCDCPVIATNMPGVRTPINKTGFGFLVPIKDPQAIADKVILTRHSNFNQRHFNKSDWDSAVIADRYIKTFNT